MKFTRFSKIGMAALATMLVAWLVLTFAFGPSDPNQVVFDGVHCTVCGRELPRGTDPKDCPYCALEKRHLERTGQAAPGGRNVKLTFPIIAGSLFFLLLAANIFAFLRNRKVQEKDEVYFHLQCPRCSRRIRFRKSQFGKAALCPLCKRPIVFPRIELAQSPWKKMKRWLRLAPQ
jgi:hypothetical protein